MRWLMRAIGRVLGITPTATPVCPTQDGLNGGNNNTVEQSQPVPQELKAKRSSVKIASSICSRSRRRSASILSTSKPYPFPARRVPVAERLNR